MLVWEKDANNSRGNCALHNKRLFSDKVGSTLEQCHLFKDKHRDYAAFSTLVHRALCLWDGVCTEKTALIWINLRNPTFFPPPKGPAEINASRSWVSNVCLTFFSSMCPFTTKAHNPEVEYSSTSSCHSMWIHWHYKPTRTASFLINLPISASSSCVCVFFPPVVNHGGRTLSMLFCHCLAHVIILLLAKRSSADGWQLKSHSSFTVAAWWV